MLVSLVAVGVGLVAVAIGCRWLWVGADATVGSEADVPRRPGRPGLVRLARGFVLLTLGLTAALFGVLGL